MQGQLQHAWSRHTAWRQGHVLSAEAADVFGLAHAVDAAATCAVVISHDCDLANDNLAAEPDVEVIVGRVVALPNGNFSWGKAPRTLHLAMQRDGLPATVELVATSKRFIAKADLARFQPCAAFALNGKALSVLRSWLGSRYNRAAFPDAFVQRMADTKLDSKLAKTLEPHGASISFVYFDIDGGQNTERSPGDPYLLSIVLVYPPGDEPEDAALVADQVVDAVEKMCEARLKEKTHIALQRCVAISEDDLPVSRARVLMQWRLEYMTLKADGEQSGPLNL